MSTLLTLFDFQKVYRTGKRNEAKYMAISDMLGFDKSGPLDSIDKHVAFRSREVNRMKTQEAPVF